MNELVYRIMETSIFQTRHCSEISYEMLFQESLKGLAL